MLLHLTNLNALHVSKINAKSQDKSFIDINKTYTKEELGGLNPFSRC